MIFVNAFSHRKVISQSPSKISQACGATKERKEFKGAARNLGSSKLSKVAKNIFGFQKPTLRKEFTRVSKNIRRFGVLIKTFNSQRKTGERTGKGGGRESLTGVFSC